VAIPLLRSGLGLILVLSAGPAWGQGGSGPVLLPLSGGTLEFTTSGGLAWRQVTSAAGTGFLDAASSKPVFCLDEDGVRLTSRDFTVGQRLSDPGGQQSLVLENAAHGWRVHFSVQPAGNGAALLGLELENLRSVARRPQVVFPVLGPVNLGGALSDVSYFFPWRTGIAGRVDCRLRSEYGSLAWMQVVAFFDRQAGRGLYLFPRDSGGLFKGIQLRKNNRAEGVPFVDHSELVLPQFEPAFPLDAGAGAGVAYHYMPRPVPASGRLAFPPVEVGFAPGGWKDALSAYGAWARTWFRKVRTPWWFQRAFTVNPAHPADFWSPAENRYTQSGTIDPRSDIVQWYKWEQYTDRSADPGLSQMEDMQPGDFLYNSDRGGLETFRAEIGKIRDKGTRFTVYINHRFCSKDSQTGQIYGPAWAAEYSPGNPGHYLHPEDKWVMPFYGPDRWVDHLAGVCRRLVRDTGMDGVYLDELSIAFPDFKADRAAQYGPEAPVPVPLIAQAVTKVRDAMRAENPEAVVYVEHAASDYMAQFTDGSWMQTYYDTAFPFAFDHYDTDSLVYFRFVFPEFKLAQWGDSRDGPNRCFFNGIGSPYYQITDFHRILHENADAFTGWQPEPLVATARERLLANRFPAEGKTVYTLYNRTGTAENEMALPVEPRPGRHYVDLRHGWPLDYEDTGGRRWVRVRLENGQVTAVADLPQRLTCERVPGGLKYRVQGDASGMKLSYGPTPDTAAGSVGLTGPGLGLEFTGGPGDGPSDLARAVTRPVDGSRLASSGAATMAAWIRPSAVNPAHGFNYILAWNGPATAYGFLRLDAANRVSFGVRVNASTTYLWAEVAATLPYDLTDGTWRHVTGSFDDGTLKLYLDGALVATEQTEYTAGGGWSVLPPDTLVVGGGYADPSDASLGFLGAIDQVRLWDAALTGAEVLSGGAGRTPLVRWNFHRTGYVGAPVDGSLPTSSRGATMAAWIRPSRINPASGFNYVLGWSGPDTAGGFVRLDAKDRLSFAVRVKAATTYQWAEVGATVPHDLTDGTWRHVAGTFDDGLLKLYLDGALVAGKQTEYTSGGGWSILPPDTFVAGGGFADPADSRVSYAGAIDDVRLWSAALTGAELTADAAAVEPLVRWNFHEGGGTTAGDSGALDGANPGTLVGEGVAWATGSFEGTIPLPPGRAHVKLMQDGILQDCWVEPVQNLVPESTNAWGIWNFNEGAGSTAYDNVSFPGTARTGPNRAAHHAAIEGAVWTNGLSGSGLLFRRGTTDRVSLGRIGPGPHEGLNPFALEFSIKFDPAAPSGDGIIAWQNEGFIVRWFGNGSGRYGLWVGARDGSAVYADIPSSPGWAYDARAAEWTRWAVGFSWEPSGPGGAHRGVTRIFKNGQLMNQATNANGFWANGEPVHLGFWPPSSGPGADYVLDEVAFRQAAAPEPLLRPNLRLVAPGPVVFTNGDTVATHTLSVDSTGSYRLEYTDDLSAPWRDMPFTANTTGPIPVRLENPGTNSAPAWNRQMFFRLR